MVRLVHEFIKLNHTLSENDGLSELSRFDTKELLSLAVHCDSVLLHHSNFRLLPVSLISPDKVLNSKF